MEDRVGEGGGSRIEDLIVRECKLQIVKGKMKEGAAEILQFSFCNLQFELSLLN